MKISNKNDVKICSKCKQIKLITEYNKDKIKSSKLYLCCKTCKSLAITHYRNNIRQINANKIFTENDVRTCSTCKQK